MQVREIMSERLEAVAPDVTIQQAAEKMRDLDVGMLPVIEHSGELLGTVTDRDIVVQALASGKDCNIPVREVMHQGVVQCYDDDDVSEAAHKMEQHQIRRIVICDHDNKPVGIVAQADIATKTDDPRLKDEVLRNISQPTH